MAGITWGLPASDGWDDDGIAPRNFLVGLVETYAGGSFFTYPPLHMIVLTILTAPGWITALFRAHSFAQRDVIAEIIQVPFMTFFAVVARLVSAAMSVGTIYLVGKMAETVGGRRAGLFAAAACALNAALTYYGQVTNLDGPYLFWSALSLWGCMRVIAEHELRHVRWAALSAVAAVATKDQAYAVFLISAPLILLIWLATDPWPRANARSVMTTILLWTGIAAFALLAIDGAIVNPVGFARRVSFLIGPASKDYAQYQNNWIGRAVLLKDMWSYFPRYYPPAAALLGVFGVLLHAVRLRRDRALFVAGLLPLLAIVSFTIAFNFVALRSESRFFLPQSILLAVYIGIAVDRFVFGLYPSMAEPLFRYVVRGLVLAIAVAAFYQCAGIDAAFLGDPRYDAERWLRSNVHSGDTIETYGLNAYLPRFPKDAYVTRLDTKKLTARNPLPHVTELDQPFGSVAKRHPRFIVVSGFWVKDYLKWNPVRLGDGRANQEVRQSTVEDADARSYFRALFDGKLPYRLAYKSVYKPGFWPPEDAYESLAQTIFLFERQVPAQASIAAYKAKPGVVDTAGGRPHQCLYQAQRGNLEVGTACAGRGRNRRA
ncbi:MAG: glycosyltransferase family 39 protein [Alphaproteobacteria bacterium]|nr:glycosyltransferase family 39 protein [Alphaproteobacteria bacterium]MDE2267260.1 glycosyltransferase family 39 protein [Alphaproteobacteria bacterium]